MTSKEVYAESAGQKYQLQVLKDFCTFKEMVLSTDSWTKQYSDSQILVESRPPEDKSTGIRVVRVRREMPTVKCEDLYDTLHDAGYRTTWDENMLEGKNVAMLDSHNDIGYYAVKLPWPLKNRDFCNMRSWMEFDNGEFVIFNHSVKHPNCPEKKGFVRARSILTGYLIQPLGKGGCLLTYITLNDPCGSIPHSVINFTTSRVVPKVMSQLQKCAQKYREYAEKNHTCPRKELPWRTPKMSWTGTFHYPEEEEDEEDAVAAAAAERDRKGPNAPREGTTSRAEEHIPPLVADPSSAEGSRYSCPSRSGGARPEGGPAQTQAAATAGVGLPAIQQYTEIMHRLADVADDTFILAGRAPTVPEYVSRVGVFVDGIRRSTAHGS